MSQIDATFVMPCRAKFQLLVDKLGFRRTATSRSGPEKMLYAGVFGLILAIGLPEPIDGADEPAEALLLLHQVESRLRGWRAGYLCGLYCGYAPEPGQRLDPQQARSFFTRLCRGGGRVRFMNRAAGH